VKLVTVTRNDYGPIRHVYLRLVDCRATRHTENSIVIRSKGLSCDIKIHWNVRDRRLPLRFTRILYSSGMLSGVGWLSTPWVHVRSDVPLLRCLFSPQHLTPVPLLTTAPHSGASSHHSTSLRCLFSPQHLTPVPLLTTAPHSLTDQLSAF
jgi:hypothetical protein